MIKFRGHYHGWSDGIHLGVPGHLDGAGTGGQDPNAAELVTLCDWNDLGALESALDGSVAAIIMEPVAVNGGCLLPQPGYLAGVRKLADENGAILIFDEVITGFRLALGGAQSHFDVLPDLTILGKALGAGFPISAVCGRREYFEVVRTRRVAHVGTFNANPVCAAAALAALTFLEQQADQIYPRITAVMKDLAAALVEEAAIEGLDLTVNHVGAAAHAFARRSSVETATEAEQSDADAYRRFAAALLDEGVHVIPRGLLYVSTAHTPDDMEQTRAAIRRAAASVVASAAKEQETIVPAQ